MLSRERKSQKEKENHILLAFGTPRRALSQRLKIKKKSPSSGQIQWRNV
jgi:hypothetical protein